MDWETNRGQQQSHDPRHQCSGRVAKPRLTHTLRITLGHLSHTQGQRSGVKHVKVKRSGTHGYSSVREGEPNSFDEKSGRSFGSRSTAALLKKCQDGDMNMENRLCRRETGTLKYTEEIMFNAFQWAIMNTKPIIWLHPQFIKYFVLIRIQ